MSQCASHSALTHAVRQIRELKLLVSGAAPGEKFTFLCVFLLPRHLKLTHNLALNVDSDDSDQQPTFDDDIEDEEDGQDEGMSSLILH
jgi:hypothetical protein